MLGKKSIFTNQNFINNYFSDILCFFTSQGE